MQIVIDIKNCKECPHFEQGPRQSTDGLDGGYDWFCKKADKQIATFVEWHEEKRVKIPNWCPCKIT
jgi:hypothetical protein